MSKPSRQSLTSNFLAAWPAKLRMTVLAGAHGPQDRETPLQAEAPSGLASPRLIADVRLTSTPHGKARWTLGYDDAIRNEPLPGAFDLGLHLNQEQGVYHIAKVSQQDRATHLYVVGATGSGKTKFLEFLIRQDIIHGEGFGVIDPHGDLIEEIKGFLAYLYTRDGDTQAVTERVVLIDPTDPTQTVTFNPLEPMAGVSVAEQAGELISAFKKIWADSWGARMEDLLRNALIALGEAQLTLCELTAFFTRRPFRRSVLANVTNPTTRDYFERFDTLTDRSQVTWIEPVMNKINAFLADERMRQLFSSPTSSFDLREIMDHKKHLLIKLDKGKLKGASDLLGSLFMAKIQMAAFSRSGIPAHQRVPFALYIDEFQNFASDSFEVILSEARKYGLSLVMAHQSLSQISDSLRGLILASAGLQVYFRVNRQDASLLAKEAFHSPGGEGTWEQRISELQHLPPRTFFAKHKIQGGVVELHTLGLESAWGMLGINEDAYLTQLATVPFGQSYLRLREELVREAQARIDQAVPEVAEASVPEPREDDLPVVEPPVQTISVARPKTRTATARAQVKTSASSSPAPPDLTVDREHRRLQHLIKRLAEEQGYRAILEEPTGDGKGRVDVGLARDGQKVAFEISVTSTPDQELKNIEKCLASGYARVVLCAPEKKSLKKIQTLTTAALTASDQEKVVFMEPDALALFFETEAAGRANSEARMKGYKVKVNYQPMAEADKTTKRQALARVFVQSSQQKAKEP